MTVGNVADHAAHLGKVCNIRSRDFNGAQLFEPHHHLHAARAPRVHGATFDEVLPAAAFGQGIMAQQDHGCVIIGQDIRGERLANAAKAAGDQIDAAVAERGHVRCG